MPLLGKAPIKDHSCLETLYLTHFETDSELEEEEQNQVTKLLFKEIEKLKLRSSYHILSLLSFTHKETLNTLKKIGYLMEVSNGKVFQVIHEFFENDKSYQISSKNQNLGLELALI